MGVVEGGVEQGGGGGRGGLGGSAMVEQLMSS